MTYQNKLKRALLIKINLFVNSLLNSHSDKETYESYILITKMEKLLFIFWNFYTHLSQSFQIILLIYHGVSHIFPLK